MQRSRNQQILFVLSIIGIVVSSISLLLGIMAGISSGMVASIAISSAGSAELAAQGISQDQAALATAALMGATGVLIVSAVLGIVRGILGIRASNDASKIMPVWVLAIISLILTVVSVIMAITGGTFMSNVLSYIFSLGIDIFMFWIANNIKQEAQR